MCIKCEIHLAKGYLLCQEKKNHVNWLAGCGNNYFCGFPQCVLRQLDRFYSPSCCTGTRQGSGCSAQSLPHRPANLRDKEPAQICTACWPSSSGSSSQAPWLHKDLVEVVWSATFGLLRGQSHKQFHFSSRVRRRGKAASRNWSEELRPVSLFGVSCFMRMQQTRWLPAVNQTKQKDVVSALKTRWAVMRK